MSTESREQIKIAAKMYKCQETAQKLYREEYDQKVSFYINYVKKFAETTGLGILESILKICEDDEIRNNGMAVMLLMAAGVEILDYKE